MQLQHSYFAFHTGDDLRSVQEAQPSDKHWTKFHWHKWAHNWLNATKH